MTTVRYAVTPGGRIAYSTAGTGPPLLCDTGWITHLRMMMELYSFAACMNALTERFTVIRYDKLGCGLSDRDGADLSFDAQVAAALAVADAAGASKFRVLGTTQGGQLAAAIAARHPERVEALLLYGTCANGAGLAPEPVRDSIVGLVRAHWGLGSRMLASIFVTDPSAQEVDTFTRLQRASATAEVASGLLDEYYRTDITALLPRITAPTTVLHREGDSATAFRLGREVATLIPGAALVPLQGTSHLFYHGQWESTLAAMLDALGEPAAPEPVLTRRELEVARLVANGLTNQAIATRLAVAPRTADAHVENIRRKLEVRSRAQIAAWVTEHRLGSSPDARGQAGPGRPDRGAGTR
jgi:pimeloyl-ACP methyl ester carboxylesterase/DNA-binding CsgD family transcriptional regulator